MALYPCPNPKVCGVKNHRKPSACKMRHTRANAKSLQSGGFSSAPKKSPETTEQPETLEEQMVKAGIPAHAVAAHRAYTAQGEHDKALQAVESVVHDVKFDDDERKNAFAKATLRTALFKQRDALGAPREKAALRPLREYDFPRSELVDSLINRAVAEADMSGGNGRKLRAYLEDYSHVAGTSDSEMWAIDNGKEFGEAFPKRDREDFMMRYIAPTIEEMVLDRVVSK